MYWYLSNQAVVGCGRAAVPFPGGEIAVKRELMDILACPMCKGPLTLTVTKEEADEIVEGSLRCDSCGETYPIEDTIPNLLPPAMRE